MPHDHRIGGEPQEGEERRPGQSDSRRAIDPRIQPLTGPFVLVSGMIGRIQQQVCVDQDHR
jgi:hypothetical protein